MVNDVWEDFLGISVDPPKMRDECSQCTRPIEVCWCPGLPNPRLHVESKVIILQHPAEVKRALRTAPMLSLGLELDKCLIFRGKKFPKSYHEGLYDILHADNTILLYPSPNAVNIHELKKVGIDGQKPYNLILLDGTWPQAKTMYHSSPILCGLKTCKLVGVPISEYVIRTQPTDGCLSTLESGALSLSILEGKDCLKDALLGPLHHLCKFQLERGAITHHSKELLIKQKTYPKLVGKRLSKQLRINSNNSTDV